MASIRNNFGNTLSHLLVFRPQTKWSSGSGGAPGISEPPQTIERNRNATETTQAIIVNEQSDTALRNATLNTEPNPMRT